MIPMSVNAEFHGNDFTVSICIVCGQTENASVFWEMLNYNSEMV